MPFLASCQSISSVWQVATPSRAILCMPASGIDTPSPCAKPQKDLPAGDDAACQVCHTKQGNSLHASQWDWNPKPSCKATERSTRRSWEHSGEGLDPFYVSFGFWIIQIYVYLCMYIFIYIYINQYIYFLFIYLYIYTIMWSHCGNHALDNVTKHDKAMQFVFRGFHWLSCCRCPWTPIVPDRLMSAQQNSNDATTV